MKKTLRKFLALVLAVGMLASLALVAYAAPNQSEESESSGVSWVEVDDLDISAADLIKDSAEEAADDEDVIDPTEPVKVVIAFEGDSAIEAGYSTTDIAKNQAAISYMSKLEMTQDAILEEIANTINGGKALDIQYSYTLAANAVSTTVTYGDIEAIEAIDGVEGVYIDDDCYYILDDDVIDTTTAGEMIGSFDSWGAGYTGAGQKIAIIDTGITTGHKSFDPDAYEYSMTELYGEDWATEANVMTNEDVAEVWDLTHAASNSKGGVSAEDTYYSSKIPYIFDYQTSTTNINHTTYASDHGTHVSGIAAANKYVANGTDEDGNVIYTEAATTEDVYTVGVAPDAQIIAMGVFSSAGGASNSTYMAAIEDAIIMGCDVLNLSLGSSSAGMTYYTKSAGNWMQEMLDNLTETDTVVNFSAGNSYYWSYYSNYGYNLTQDINMDTVGSPGSYTNVLTIASADNTGSTGYPNVAAGVSFTYSETAYTNEPFTTLDTSEDGSGTEYEFVILAPGVLGNAEDFNEIDVEGKIVFVQRGEISFYVKAHNAVDAGAVATVVYNNTTGSISMDLSDYKYTNPCVSILEEEGLAIIDACADTATTTAEGVTYYTGTMTVGSTLTVNHAEDPTAATMSLFSSWGPTSDLAIKPEITAPGGDIWSTVNQDISSADYGLMSGTSMAAPSATGMIALTMQRVKEDGLVDTTGYSVRQLAQSLMMSTAVPLIDSASADGSEYSVRNQGSGLGYVAGAVSTDATIMVEGQDDGKVKAELGDDPEKTGVYSFNFDVINFGDSSLSYTLDASVLTADAFEEDGLNFMSPSDVALDSATSFTLLTEPVTELAHDLNGDGAVDLEDAMLVLQYANGKDTLTEAQIANADLSGDGVVTVEDAYLWIDKLDSADFQIAGYTNLDGDVLTIAAGTTVTLNVTITLTDEGKAWLEENYPCGGYVEGYVYLRGVGSEEGVIPVTLSIPFLAFYGNWADPSMYEPTGYIEASYDEDALMNYAATTRTNCFTIRSGNTSYYYNGNLYADDDEYLPERNAISTTSGDYVYYSYASLIRNADGRDFTVTDDATGEVIYESSSTSSYLASYYSDYWYNTTTSTSVNWRPSNYDLEDGDSVTLKMTYYNEYLDADGNQEVGAGSSIVLPMTIDNTAPDFVAANYDDAGDLVVTAHDDRYVAAVQLFNEAGTTRYETAAVNQTEQGVYSVIVFDADSIASYTARQNGNSVFNVVVVDYAGNTAEYRVALDSGSVSDVEGITLSSSSLSLLAGNTATLTATVTPSNVADNTVTWVSSDTSVATVDNGKVTALKEGTARITATTNATSSSGQRLSASCTVTVLPPIDASFDALWWDENGDVFEAEIRTTDLSTYRNIKALGSSSTVPYMAQTVGNDGTLYVSTYTGSSIDFLYTLDLTTNQATYLEMVYTLDDMDYAYYGDMIYGVNSDYNYVIVVDPDDPDDWGGYDFDDYVDGNLVGIAWVDGQERYGYYTNLDIFFLITDTGNLYDFWVVDQGAWSPELIGTIGVESTAYFDSMYYYYDYNVATREETEYLFYSAYNESAGEQTLYAMTIDWYAYNYGNTADTINGLFEIGTFPEDVWPVSGLCDLSGASTYPGGTGNITQSRSGSGLIQPSQLPTITQ